LPFGFNRFSGHSGTVSALTSAPAESQKQKRDPNGFESLLDGNGQEKINLFDA
jgi:hypothetical protein